MAREARCEAIQAAGPGAEIELSDIAFGDVQTGEPSICASFAQNGTGMGIPFNGKDGFMPKDKIGEQSATGSGEEMSCSHITPQSPE